MCGRYYVDREMLKDIESIVRRIDANIRNLQSGDRYPSQPAAVITGREPGLCAERMIWGFPGYQKKGLLINARAETVLERRMFRESVLHRRCVIPATYFYEWNPEKEKVTFLREDGSSIYMAGFYHRFQGEDRFVILTTLANASVESVHHRMPVILEREELEMWVYDDHALSRTLEKIPPQLEKYQEYEQQRLF